jgi:excisionase family DNA binding protein
VDALSFFTQATGNMDRVSTQATSGRSAVVQLFGTTELSRVLTLKQTATYLRVSKAHLSNLIAGKVPGVPHLRHVRAGRRILIKREWADEWLETAAQESLCQW